MVKNAGPSSSSPGQAFSSPNNYNGDPSSSSFLSAAKNVTNAVLQMQPKLPNVLAFLVVTLYVLNQTHSLPKPLSRIVSKVLFWPTLPITVSKRIGKWSTNIDETVMMGGAPFGFARMPKRLHAKHGVRGIINMCEEYQGPSSHYKRLGMRHLRLPTADHFVPTVSDLQKAVRFIKAHELRGERVYVHCRAGHGRSAAAVFAWLLYKDPIVDLEKLNQEFTKKRNVKSTLWKQPSIKMFHSWLLKEGGSLSAADDDDDDFEDSEESDDDDESFDDQSSIWSSLTKESVIKNFKYNFVGKKSNSQFVHKDHDKSD